MPSAPEGLPFYKAKKPYECQPELIRDCISFAETLIYEYSLYYAEDGRLSAELGQDGRDDLNICKKYFDGRLSATAGKLPLACLLNAVNAGCFERNCIMLSLAASLDERISGELAKMQHENSSALPLVSLVSRMCALPLGDGIEEKAVFFSGGLFQGFFESEALSRGRVKPAQCFIEMLSGGEAKGFTLTDLKERNLPVRGELAEQLARRIKADAKQPAVSVLYGCTGSGRRYIAQNAYALAGKGMLIADVSRDPAELILQAALMAETCGCGLVLMGLDPNEERDVTETASKTIKDSGVRHVFIVSEQKLTGLSRTNGLTVFREELGLPSADERFTLIEYFAKGLCFAEDVSLSELAEKFTFFPLQIKNAMEQAAAEAKLECGGVIDSQRLHKCCYAQVMHRLDDMATRVRTGFSWNDLVLPESEKQLLMQACSHIKYKHRVFSEWDFNSKLSYGRGLSMLFTGPPGTGKTMGAQIMAEELHMELFQIQLSQVMSKYIGETEKNLREIFKEAKYSSSILFFDECDALFGKRSEVKDSNDRYANAETAYLLQQIEEHDGVTILATNLLQNIDAAFMRRIRFVVHFPFPDAPSRSLLFKKTVPEKMPVDSDMDYDFLANAFNVAGGNIKNIVLQAAFFAAREGKPLNMQHMLKAGVNELKKNNIIVVKEDLREYADLVF